MSGLTGKQIQDEARKILEGAPQGIKWSKLLQAISVSSPATSKNTIQGNLHKMLKGAADITKLAKGFYVLSKFAPADGSVVLPPTPGTNQMPAGQSGATANEAAYYEPFGEWLKEQLEDATEVMIVGGNVLKGKWGTPDVIGVLKPQTSDPVKFPAQIVSAEIKLDPNQPVVAFGQAVSYRLFSHKSYIVVPNTTTQADMERLEALATISGIGLVTFELNPAAPAFTLVIRAVQAQPDMYYANEMARRLQEVSLKDFNRLFSGA